jgi:hypothetical protein
MGLSATDIGIGGNPIGAAGYRYGDWSTAPASLPPDVQQDGVGWIRRDTGVGGIRYVGSLPLTWSANGLQWSLASDLATAKGNVTTYPALSAASDGQSLLYEGGLPQTWTGDGVEHVVAASLTAARSERTQTPAVLWESGGNTARLVI